MKYFIKNLNEYKNYGMSKYIWFEAVRMNDIEIIKEYLANGFDVNCSTLKKTALIIACENNHLDMVKELLKYSNINVNYQDNDNRTALLLATYYGYSEIVKKLLTHPNINVNIQDSDKGTALIWASAKNNTEIVKELLTHPSINVNLLDFWGNSALFYAKRNNNTEIKKILREVGTKE